MEQDINIGTRAILEYFQHWEQQEPDRPFLRQPFGADWKVMSYGEVGLQARKLLAYLHSLGIEKGDKIGLLSKNCSQWIIADLAMMMGGYVSVPFYPNLTGAQLAEVIERSEAKLLFVGKLEEWENQRSHLRKDLPIIRFPYYLGNSKVEEGVSWEEIQQNHEPVESYEIPKLEELWTILFTSGTTGIPKGVMLQHKCPALIIRNEEIHDHLQFFNGLPNRFFSYLPLNHIAERIVVEVASIVTGGTISFAESIDTFPYNLEETQPTLFIAVPRIWTKFQMGILKRLPQSVINLLLAIPIVSTLFKKKIKQKLGLSKARIILTGAAPTPNSLKDWYAKLGIRLREVYGMTEACGGCTIMPEHENETGSVGKPVPNVELAIDPANDEVLIRMPWMMEGYFKDEKKTNQIMQDGWIHTGDSGAIDSNGFLFITGRVKDAFKSSKGKYIVPAPLEWALAKNQYIEQVCVVGLQLPQPIALILLSKAADVEKSLANTLEEVNLGLAKHERLASLIILKDDWSVENDLLTPTMKLKRNRVHDNYQSQYSVWFAEEKPVIWTEAPLIAS